MLPVPGLGPDTDGLTVSVVRHRWLNHLGRRGPDPLTRPGLRTGEGAEGPPPSKKTSGVGVFFFDLWTWQETSTQEAEEKAKHRSSQQPVGNHNTHDIPTRVMSPKSGCGAGAFILALWASFWALLLAVWAFDFGFLGFHFGVLGLPLPRVYCTTGLKLGASGFPEACPQVLRPSATTRQAPWMGKTARIFGVAPRQPPISQDFHAFSVECTKSVPWTWSAIAYQGPQSLR